MPAQTLRVPYQEFFERNWKHVTIANALPRLEPALQKALAELVLIRLFDDFQVALAGIAYRLACGTAYLDTTAPNLLVTPARSTSGARFLFENHSRTKQKYVKWSTASFITDTTKYVLDQSDPFIRACRAQSLVISEMQAVSQPDRASKCQFSGTIRRCSTPLLRRCAARSNSRHPARHPAR